MKTSTISHIASYLTAICLVLALASVYSWSRFHSVPPQALATTQEAVLSADYIHPVSLTISSLRIKVPIRVGSYTDGWDLDLSSVWYVADTPIPGKRGNSVLYGHNSSSLLGRLDHISLGSQIEIAYVDGSQRIFSVTQVFEVTPDQTHILEQSEDTRITLYTCTGLLDSRRLVVIAQYSPTTSHLPELP